MTFTVRFAPEAAEQLQSLYRVVIAIVVDDAAERVDVLGVFAGGQDYESVLAD